MRDAASATPRAIWMALKETFRREGENHGRKQQEDFSGCGRSGGARRLVRAAVRGVQAGVLCIPLREALPKNSTHPITSFKTAWSKVRKKSGVKGRWHDNRHTLVTNHEHRRARLALLPRADGSQAARQRVADEKRQQEVERPQAAVVSSIWW
jgi:hypothetical protein